MSGKCKWSHSQVEKLINLVQQNDCIYNIRSADYLNRDMKAQAFNKICDEMQLEMGEINVAEVKKKWKNLRTQFLRDAREVQASKKSGSGICDVSTPKLWCFSQLQFLESHTKIREGKSNYEDVDSPPQSPECSSHNDSQTTDDYNLIVEPRRKRAKKDNVFCQLQKDLSSFKGKISERQVRPFAWLGNLVSAQMDDIKPEQQNDAAWCKDRKTAHRQHHHQNLLICCKMPWKDFLTIQILNNCDLL